MSCTQFRFGIKDHLPDMQAVVLRSGPNPSDPGLASWAWDVTITVPTQIGMLAEGYRIALDSLTGIGTWSYIIYNGGPSVGWMVVFNSVVPANVLFPGTPPQFSITVGGVPNPLIFYPHQTYVLECPGASCEEFPGNTAYVDVVIGGVTPGAKFVLAPYFTPPSMCGTYHAPNSPYLTTINTYDSAWQIISYYTSALPGIVLGGKALNSTDEFLSIKETAGATEFRLFVNLDAFPLVCGEPPFSVCTFDSTFDPIPGAPLIDFVSVGLLECCPPSSNICCLPLGYQFFNA